MLTIADVSKSYGTRELFRSARLGHTKSSRGANHSRPLTRAAKTGWLASSDAHYRRRFQVLWHPRTFPICTAWPHKIVTRRESFAAIDACGENRLAGQFRCSLSPTFPSPMAPANFSDLHGLATQNRHAARIIRGH